MAKGIAGQHNKDAAAVKAWLKAHGHKAKDVDAGKYSSRDELVATLCRLHGMKPEQYEQGGLG